jgi:hypothetical protein
MARIMDDIVTLTEAHRRGDVPGAAEAPHITSRRAGRRRSWWRGGGCGGRCRGGAGRRGRPAGRRRGGRRRDLSAAPRRSCPGPGSFSATSAATVTPNILAIFDSESPAWTMYSDGTAVVVAAGAAVVGGSVGSGVVGSSPCRRPRSSRRRATKAIVRATSTAVAERRRLPSMLTRDPRFPSARPGA